jgi:peptide/nickel transport system ATP-binding protein
MPTSESVVRLRGVEKTFVKKKGFRKNHAIHALRGVDLDLQKGESVALVGESGSGKTTLLRIVAGLETADAGEIDVTPDRPQMVFQDALASLTPWLSVEETLKERLARLHLPKEEVKDRIARALDLVGLAKSVLKSRPRQLSGGQAQRVAIARAIVDPPGLLLADEPTSSLDISLRAVVLNLLNRLRRELGLTVLFVTHDLAAARVIADRVIVMHLGEIVESGEPDAVVHRPSHAYTQQLIASLPGESAPTLEGLGG